MDDKLNQLIINKNIPEIFKYYSEEGTIPSRFFLEELLCFLGVDVSANGNVYKNLTAEGVVFQKAVRVWKLNDIILFGKYKGKSIIEIMKNDISYIKWCILNVDNFIITDLFFLFKEVYECLDLIELLSVNLVKTKFLKDQIIIHEEKESESWEDSMLNDGFEGDIDVWNHYNQ